MSKYYELPTFLGNLLPRPSGPKKRSTLKQEAASYSEMSVIFTILTQYGIQKTAQRISDVVLNLKNGG
jgi:hypothetical protein